jgi:glyoxylase-like metal-dependent hydrolase (beta-lactamase superfamily II)
MDIDEFNDLFLIDLPQKMTGYRRFTSTWVIKEGSSAVLVDVGPASTIPLLKEGLDSLGIKKVEYILLTHIHIDHAGGTADLLKFYPDARVVVNEKGEKHLINPEKLMEGSRKVLGKSIVDVYGEIKPVPAENIHRGVIEFAGSEIEIIKTPGHAVHHQSYVFEKYLFAGEAAGVFHRFEELSEQLGHDTYYARPATPPRYIYEVAEESARKLMGVGAKHICYGHFGMADAKKRIEEYLNQQKLWFDTVLSFTCQHIEMGDQDIIAEVRKILMDKDDLISKFSLLDDDIKEREDYYINNALLGMVRYAREKCS